MAEVESFTLDHTAVKAPYVRLINVEAGPKGDQISNFDVRLLQPNAGEIPTSGLHTIEHLLASLLRDRIDGVIDCSPFGCRTGFHLIMWGAPSVREVTEALASSLHAIAEEVTWEDVPGTDDQSRPTASRTRASRVSASRCPSASSGPSAVSTENRPSSPRRTHAVTVVPLLASTWECRTIERFTNSLV